jgi:predicted Fe-S protein YdhL (DUF1289 family)
MKSQQQHQLIASTQDQLSSPCVKNCCLDDNDICLGCFRSLEEIRKWRQVDDDTRHCFLINAQCRKKDHKTKITPTCDTGDLQ